MKKLLNAYVKNPTIENARRIYKYENAHPMASTMLDADELKVLKAALRQERDDRCPVVGRPSLTLVGM